MNMRVKVLLLIGLVSFLYGCAGVLNPYGDEFACPKTYKGKCVSIQKAYEESLDPKFHEPEDTSYRYEFNRKKSPCQGGNCGGGSSSTGRQGTLSLDSARMNTEQDSGNGAYLSSLYEKMTGLLKEPTTPVVVPPKVMRILIFSYTGDSKELFMPRYVYFMADEPKWMLIDPRINTGQQQEED